tara:strand:- start:2399 stop:2662 length:264 start_codon:yes stop_codon:yes gene_type:complete
VTAPDHTKIYERIGVLEVQQSHTQNELTEFKTESRQYREENRENMAVVVDWVKEEKTRRRLIKKALKAFAWFLGLVATGVAIFKGVR